MRSIKILCLMLLLVPLWADDFEDYEQTAQQLFEGEKIFDEMVQALGDVYSLRTMRTFGITSQPVEYGSLSMPVQVELKFPDKLRISLEDKEFIIEDDKGWLKYPQGFYENLPQKYINTLNGNLNRNLIVIAKSEDDYNIKLLGENTVLNRACYELELEQDGEVVKLYIDKQRRLPVRLIYSIKKNIVIRTFIEYKSFAGIQYPVRTISTDADGNLISEIVIEKVEFNIKLEVF